MRIEPQYWDPESCQPKLAHQLREILPMLMRVPMREKDGSQRGGNIANWEKNWEIKESHEKKECHNPRKHSHDRERIWEKRIWEKKECHNQRKHLSWQTEKEFEKELSHDRESICHDRESVEPNIETPMSSNSMAQLPSIQSSSTSTPPNGWEYM